MRGPEMGKTGGCSEGVWEKKRACSSHHSHKRSHSANQHTRNDPFFFLVSGSTCLSNRWDAPSPHSPLPNSALAQTKGWVKLVAVTALKKAKKT
ncbi:hypothetical protein AYI68_g2435 [Smittium mucronatum]|uniref:Uncharacterized protein n=1 Tax=Smittium mucronatum TaxID=133383 RepID=A0A1R0H2R7_9FUNG|nr:hypothetical protein AYI68_g2435 [Smittium mucronatum]